jgi:glycosyltransferase involved in cell wall biosynthesis
MTDRSISVVVPAFNSEATIEKCLEALAAQSLPPLEVIVVDDGSTDGTAALARRHTWVLSNPRTRGPAGARNAGAYLARGGIIAFTDSDCIPPRDWLKNIAAALSDENTGAVGGGYSCGADGSFWQVFSCEELAFRRRKRSGRVTTLVSNNFACRRESFIALGGFPEQYRVCEDMFFSYKMSRKSRVLWLADNGVGHHFKTSLGGYLKHQYFFGAESTRFFMENSRLLGVGNHQGRRLHAAIAFAWGTMVFVAVGMALVAGGNMWIAGLFFPLSLMLLAAHGACYAGFIAYLAGQKFPWQLQAYGVCFLRDVVCGFSFFDGIVRVFLKR